MVVGRVGRHFDDPEVRGKGVAVPEQAGVDMEVEPQSQVISQYSTTFVDFPRLVMVVAVM
jgi:hypothetical protein